MDAPLLHRHVGEHAAKCKIDLLIAIGELSKHTYKGMVESGGKALYYSTKDEFLSDADKILCNGDVVLIKASHFMKFDEIVERLK